MNRNLFISLLAFAGLLGLAGLLWLLLLPLLPGLSWAAVIVIATYPLYQRLHQWLSWHARAPLTRESADTFADGLATRMSYELTFPALCEGLEDFVTVTDAEIADALRMLHRLTGTTPEGAGAAGLAGLSKLGLSRQCLAIVVSGANIDDDVRQRVLEGHL